MSWSLVFVASSLLQVRGDVVGNIRVQFLPNSVVRIETKGPKGFEDRTTFNIVHRPALLKASRLETHDRVELRTEELAVLLPKSGELRGVRVVDRAGKLRYEVRDMPEVAAFPAPGESSAGFAFADAPRIVPSPSGAAPNAGKRFPETSGWDVSNLADDLYLMLSPNYTELRKSFLKLTGPIPLPPLYAFGLWHSRFHPYTEQTALETIDKYRARGFPLDVFVVDTDWRLGASHGYTVNKDLFPNMARFLEQAQARGVRVVFNDHPEPVADGALDPKELRFRASGLRSLLELGADAWWYDRNWKTKLIEPAPGLIKEVWGAALFHDITLRAKPNRRPLVLTNVPGIKHGKRQAPDPVATHRYPIWWTGDTGGQWNYLKQGIENAVDSGIESLLPYLSEDLGGHWGRPKPDLYTRFVQYGALSPVMRLHSTKGETREPWFYGHDAEAAALAYVRLRYRLMPTIYAAARRAHEDGTPLLRRGDPLWPSVAGSNRSDQYLLGDDLLVAPLYEVFANPGGPSKRTVWIPPGKWIDLWGGVVQGPQEIAVSSGPTVVPLYARAGAVILTTSAADRTRRAVWPITVAECFPSAEGTTSRLLYEDDGISNDYLKGASLQTLVTMKRAGKTISFRVAPSPSSFRVPDRTWKIRLHLAPNDEIASASLSGRRMPAKPMPLTDASKTWTPLGDTSIGDESHEIVLPKRPAHLGFELTVRLR